MSARLTMLQLMWTSGTLGLVMLAMTSPGVAFGAHDEGDSERPSLSLRAAPTVAFAPARIRVTAEVKGGPDDFEDLYCPSIEWEWGDGTKSSSSADCAPYAAGSSEIRRRYTVEHVYRHPGNFRIRLRLKKGPRTTGFANTAIQVRPGLPGQ